MNELLESRLEKAQSPHPSREPILMTVKVDPSLVPNFEAMAELTRNLPETDGEPLATPWHLAAISLLIEILTYFWRDRDDFFVGGNMFVYYSLRQIKTEEYKGPDFLFVKGAERHRPREFWVVWEEGGKYPDLIVEFISRTTATEDRTTKKEIYQNTFRTPEYFCYDPATDLLQGWRLREGIYEDIEPDPRGWMWSESLQLWLGRWTGEVHGLQAVWLRFYDSGGRLVPLRAEAEQQRADAAEAELARLKAQLADLDKAR